MSEDTDFPNADADPRGHQRLPRRAEFGGELSSSGLPAVRAGVECPLCPPGGRPTCWGLSLLLRPFEAVICAESTHLNVDESGRRSRFWAPGC